MTQTMGFSKTRRIPLRIISLVGFLTVIAILLLAIGQLAVGPALASSHDPLHQRQPVPGQVAHDEDASLGQFRVTANGEAVALVPQFDPATTLYTVTVAAESVDVIAAVARTGAVIDRVSVGDNTLTLDSLIGLVTVPADLTEGATTVVSLRVRAADQVTTETYYVILSRPADPSVPDITIQATPSEYVAGIGTLSFTVTRGGPRDDAPGVTVNFTQDEDWLSDTTRTFHFSERDETITEFIPPTEFSSSVIRSGNLVATVAPVAGYDTSGVAPVKVISQEGPAVSVTLDQSTYTVAEGAGTLDVVIVARAHSSVPRVDGFNVGILSDAQTASSSEDSRDFHSVSSQPRFNSSDFEMEGGVLVGSKTVTITIVDDAIYEGDETFHLHVTRATGLTSEVKILDPDGEECSLQCPNPYVVTITDNEPAVAVSFGQAAYTVIEGGSQAVVVTVSDPPLRTVRIPIVAVGQDGATGDDYSGVPRTVTFNATETSKTFSFSATYDTIDDGGESVKLSFGSMLPPGVAQGPVNETVVTITQRELIHDIERPGISVPMCQSNGISFFWHAAPAFEDDPPPHGWRVERRRLSGGE
ncbi:MAG: hypothetical protein OXI91_03815 [Chloroflexota bacterium]|nr:hypothetical protein [Chloroflexota bacterium]